MCKELKEVKRRASEMESKLEEKWQGILSKLGEVESKGDDCEPTAIWFPDGPIVGNVISPPPWESTGPIKGVSQDRLEASSFEVKTVPVLEVTRKEGEKEEREEVYPTMTILPGQPVPFRAIGKDVDKLRMGCSNGFSKEITLNDLLYYYWKARWLDEPISIWEDLAELPQIAGGIEKISAVMEGIDEFLSILKDVRESDRVTEDSRRKLKELYKRYSDVEWLREILMEYIALDKLPSDMGSRSTGAMSQLERDEGLLIQLIDNVLPNIKRYLEEARCPSDL